MRPAAAFCGFSLWGRIYREGPVVVNLSQSRPFAYTYIYIHTRMCVYIYRDRDTYVHISISTHIKGRHIHVHTCIHPHVATYKCIRRPTNEGFTTPVP